MRYPDIPDFPQLISQLRLYSQLKHEYGARGIPPVLQQAESALKRAVRRLKKLPVDPEKTRREPNSLAAIRRLRPAGPRRLWHEFRRAEYLDRLDGALLGRFAGCILGSPVEGWPVARMADWAREVGDRFPPTDYWTAVPDPSRIRYLTSRCDAYTRRGMDGVPVDDDLAYTLLGLIVLEENGPGFSLADLGQAWRRYLPLACTAEAVALDNLKSGLPPNKAADRENPYCEWIGADIRADPWGYVAPGLPELAAGLAWRDAYLTHRRNGIYGEMFFAASIAAAFALDDPLDALRVGLTEIPRECALARAVRWAFRTAPKIEDYQQARAAVDRKFMGMSPVHTINNACLTVFGLGIGGTDLTEVISHTVAMGLDNDCTAATAGNVAGAIVGKSGIPKHWYRGFNNTVHSYLLGRKRFTISGLVKRFGVQAGRLFDAHS